METPTTRKDDRSRVAFPNQLLDRAAAIADLAGNQTAPWVRQVVLERIELEERERGIPAPVDNEQ